MNSMHLIDYETPKPRPRWLSWLLVITTVGLTVLAVRTAIGAEIVGPERIDEHRLAIFEPRGGEKSSYAWTVHPIGIADVHTHGDSVVFTGRPGEYTLQLIEVGPSGDPAKPFEITQTFRNVTIGPAPPPPPPNPPPGPKDPFVSFVYSLAKSDPQTAAKIAENYSSVISRINAGAYASLSLDGKDGAKQAIANELLAANKPYSDAKPVWRKFFDELRTRMDADEKAGQHNTLEAVAAKLAKIQEGLSLAK